MLRIESLVPVAKAEIWRRAEGACNARHNHSALTSVRRRQPQTLVAQKQLRHEHL